MTCFHVPLAKSYSSLMHWGIDSGLYLYGSGCQPGVTAVTKGLDEFPMGTWP